MRLTDRQSELTAKAFELAILVTVDPQIRMEYKRLLVQLQGGN